MAKGYIKRCSVSLIIREMQTKPMIISLHTFENDYYEKYKNNKCWQGCGEKGTPVPVGGNVNWFSHYGDFSKN